MRVRLIGGSFDGLSGILSDTPPRVTVGRSTYVRVDDPDTGVFLGGYAFVRPEGIEPPTNAV